MILAAPSKPRNVAPGAQADSYGVSIAGKITVHDYMSDQKCPN